MSKINRKQLTAVENRLLTDELFVTVSVDGVDGEDSYVCAFSEAADAVEVGDSEGELVATYKLVAVEKLALKRTTTLVKVK